MQAHLRPSQRSPSGTLALADLADNGATDHIKLLPGEGEWRVADGVGWGCVGSGEVGSDVAGRMCGLREEAVWPAAA